MTALLSALAVLLLVGLVLAGLSEEPTALSGLFRNREERRAALVEAPVKIALWVLALLGGVWGARWMGDGGDTWGTQAAHATFYEDGAARSLSTLAQGELHGPARTWHRGGALASEGDYARGERQGPWRFWREDGSLDLERSGVYEGGLRGAPLAD